MSRSKRQAVIVLGMHRSGTSALAGVLSLMGAQLPARLMPAGPGNPKGYFEPGHIVTIHDRILAAAGTWWAGWERISDTWLRSAECESFVDELTAAVVEDYGTSELLMVKDPRMCRLMPLWFRVLERIDAQASFVLAFRNPVEVARSVQRREGLPLPHGCVAWLRCVLEAEHQTRGHPRAFLSYGDLLADPRAAIERVVAALPVDWPRTLDEIAGEIREFVEPGLRHQVAERSAIDALGDRSPWLRQALSYCEALAHAGDDCVLTRLDALRAEFDAADALFTPAYKHDGLAEVAGMRGPRAGSRRESGRHQAEVAALRRSLSEREQVVAESAKRIAALDQARAAAEAQVAALDHALAERHAHERALADALARSDALASSLQSTIAAMRRSTSWRLTVPLRSVEGLLGRLRYRGAVYALMLAWTALKSRSPAPLREWRDARLIARSDLFDAGWYQRSNPDIAVGGADPVRHYVALGAREGRDPSASFGTRGYLAQYPDVAAAGANPLAHFIRFGLREGRAILPSAAIAGHPAVDVEAMPSRWPPGTDVAPPVELAPADPDWRYPSRELLEADCALLRDSGLLDPEAYRAAAEIDAQADPAEHYLLEGWRAGVEPGPRIEGRALYPYFRSVGCSGPPAITYLKLRASGASAVATPADAQAWAAIIRSSPLFDADRYAAGVDDIGTLDSALHYVIVGEAKGIPPSASFDPVYYRERNPDVAATGTSLLGHYICSGRSEGRRTVSSAAHFTFDRSRLRSGRKVVVVISHEASRTGAPILAWNVAARLSQQYDVVAVLLGGGELLDSFARTCAAVIGPLPRDQWHPLEAEYVVRRLIELLFDRLRDRQQHRVAAVRTAVRHRDGSSRLADPRIRRLHASQGRAGRGSALVDRGRVFQRPHRGIGAARDAGPRSARDPDLAARPLRAAGRAEDARV